MDFCPAFIASAPHLTKPKGRVHTDYAWLAATVRQRERVSPGYMTGAESRRNIVDYVCNRTFQGLFHVTNEEF